MTEVNGHTRGDRGDVIQAQLGASRQTVVSIEGGDYAPSVLLALRIASTLDRPVEDLFFIDTTKES